MSASSRYRSPAGGSGATGSTKASYLSTLPPRLVAADRNRRRLLGRSLPIQASDPPLEEPPLRVRLDQVEGPLVGGSRLGRPIQAEQQICPARMRQVMVLETPILHEPVDQGEARSRAVVHGDRYG